MKVQRFMRRLIRPRPTARLFFSAKPLIGRSQVVEMRALGVGAKSAGKGQSVMMETLGERVWAWLHETFPERQIYIRSDGRVQFFTFGPSFQATIAGLTLIFLCWVAFATVNVVFKDRLIAAKNHRYQVMQTNYENRYLDLQTAYDELNGALIADTDRFNDAVNALQAKQNTIIKFIQRKQQVDQTLEVLANGGVAPRAQKAPRPIELGNMPTSTGFTDSDSEPTLTVEPQQSQMRVKPTHASMLDIGGTVGTLSGLLFGRIRPQVTATNQLQLPALNVISQQTLRVKQIGISENQLLEGTEQRLTERVSSLADIIRRTGIDPAQFQQKFAANEGVGGPDIPIQAVQIEGIADDTFRSAYLSASAILEQMNGVLSELRHVPLTQPVHGEEFNRTSGFGPRIDPFTGRASFHPGVDFSGPYGSDVTATAAGTVVWAGVKGGYGNLVEIDHGYGIHTRYGHLAVVLVRPGAKVRQGSLVGKLGSTGRSTGPHVHYEVWYDNVVRNPANFIDAGRHVLE